jgi:hypothetical protein
MQDVKDLELITDEAEAARIVNLVKQFRDRAEAMEKEYGLFKDGSGGEILVLVPSPIMTTFMFPPVVTFKATDYQDACEQLVDWYHGADYKEHG